MINGILNIKKEAGFTSHDVVAKLRGIVHQKKIGHTGTLDPDATGVLPVCLGKATKLCDLIGDWDKTYEAVLLLGRETDTEDTGGTTCRESKVEVTEKEIEEIILSFVGDYSQIPPMYSAKKVNGKKLYELAREGIVIERKPCPVNISSIEVKEIDLPRVKFEVTCSKGTYIRSLCRDIGMKAGCGGCMEHLTRTRVASFSIGESCTLSEIDQMQKDGVLSEKILPIDKVFAAVPAVFVEKEGEKKLYNGNPVPSGFCREKDSLPGIHEKCRVYDSQKNFVGIYTLEKNDLLKPYKLFL
ncbi:MAG: tRNA pseudouridine(55) synthase TruB [Lachnospiraceae bacterium]|nr:tRNA pseudouridine(55) synthase TruB [Lachnospiraceae bacterium]MDY5497746.1 tRNA pseudouridine(55) synthase TruB [Anaerobutyricum sp.]